ncbi:flagellar motor switch protein FliM [Erwinia typographi]|uniref:Flagellar motor switch protein FliM n=1 Tax=Erwinia typographi TaxID=371042 RepID=A0A0A3Z395_9GAMM|nr:flagellar motor switch protein FliM [Erwinia typographi]KGT93345.1 flagellar motor switch protein FliM [Erwinia typographi]
MSDSMLSQAEIDSLLNGGAGDDKENVRAALALDDEIKPYDPHTQRRVVRERLHSLEIINERFARQFRIGLFNLLRRSTDVTVGNVIIQPYHEFARNLPVPTNLNLFHMNPLRGTALLVFSPNLVFMAIDNLFGGDGRFPTKVEGREFTPTEQRIINRILEMALEAYDQAWSSIFKLEMEYVRAEIQVKFTNITSSPNDIVVTAPFHVEIGAHSGDFNICIPFSMIEPLRELLTSPPMENSRQENDAWHDTLASQVRDTELELVAKFAEIETRLSKILTLKEGDVIPIDIEENIEAMVDGVPMLSAKYGALNNQYALKVESLFNPAFLSNNKE